VSLKFAALCDPSEAVGSSYVVLDDRISDAKENAMFIDRNEREKAQL
jgi:hypothetical protein